MNHTNSQTINPKSKHIRLKARGAIFGSDRRQTTSVSRCLDNLFRIQCTEVIG